MTREEAVALCRYVKACCPQQAMDTYTPDAWHDLLGDLTLDDCRAAVVAVAQRQPFVSPSEIREEVRRVRSDRIGPAGPGLMPAPPPADPDDVAGYLRALRTQQAAVADGHQPRAAILAGPADPHDNPTARAIIDRFRAEQDAARRRKAEQDRADREALALYRDAVEQLLALPDHGAAALATARDRVYGDTEAATGYPLLASLPGVMDEHKIHILAARIAAETDPS